MKPEKLIREYLAEIFHMSLATSVNNKPWICEVHYVYDDKLNFYFLSKPGRRHSKEIAVNPSVAGNVVRQHGAKDKPQGIYFEGTAVMVDGAPESIYKLYDQRFGLGPAISKEIVDDPEGHKFYKITPTSFVLFDAVNFPDSPRREWSPA